MIGVAQSGLTVLPFVLQRRHLRQLTEGEAEVALVAEAHPLAHLRNGLVGRGQQLSREEMLSKIENQKLKQFVAKLRTIGCGAD